MGMNEEVQEKVFEPFFSTKSVGEGSGLGLASVYGTMQLHDGGVNVFSAKGVGTTFNLYFPISTDHVADAGETNDRVMEKGEGTVVIVDDEEMITDMVSNLLSKCGYTVHAFCDGLEAIGWYEKHYLEADLIILDMIMPVIDGMECYERLKKINPDIKVIIASGYSKNNKVQKLINQGALSFIEKPFDKVSLSKIVARVIQKKQNEANTNLRVASKYH
jgi:CheY-like chemotaxis protein